MKRKILLLTLFSFVSLFIIQALLIFLLFLFFEQKPDNNWTILISNISFIFVIWFTLKLLDIKINLKFNLPKTKVLWYIILLAVCFIFSYPFIAVFNFTSAILDNILEFTKLNFLLDKTSIFYFFNIVFITPILEELYYRKIILHQIEKQNNAFLAILISSVLFSVFHMDYTQCQLSFVFGLISGYLYFKTKKIEISIILHSLINLLTIITANSTLNFDKYYVVIVFYLTLVLFGIFLIKKIVTNAN